MPVFHLYEAIYQIKVKPLLKPIIEAVDFNNTADPFALRGINMTVKSVSSQQFFVNQYLLDLNPSGSFRIRFCLDHQNFFTN